ASLFEKISHTRGTNTDKHFHKIRARHAEKWHARFTGHGLCKQCFSRSWWTHQNGTTRKRCSKSAVFVWILEEIYKFNNFLLGLRHTGDIFEGCCDLMIRANFDLSRSKNVHHATTTTLQVVEHSQQDYNIQQ